MDDMLNLSERKSLEAVSEYPRRASPMRIPGSDSRTHNGHPAAIIRHDSDGHFRWAIVNASGLW
jgi:hypothetical protein